MISFLAKMLGLSPDQADASMKSEAAARAVLTRRNFFAAGAAMAASATLYSMPGQLIVEAHPMLVQIPIGISADVLKIFCNSFYGKMGVQPSPGAEVERYDLEALCKLVKRSP